MYIWNVLSIIQNDNRALNSGMELSHLRNIIYKPLWANLYNHVTWYHLKGK